MREGRVCIEQIPYMASAKVHLRCQAKKRSYYSHRQGPPLSHSVIANRWILPPERAKIESQLTAEEPLTDPLWHRSGPFPISGLGQRLEPAVAAEKSHGTPPFRTLPVQREWDSCSPLGACQPRRRLPASIAITTPTTTTTTTSRPMAAMIAMPPADAVRASSPRAGATAAASHCSVTAPACKSRELSPIGAPSSRHMK